MKKNNVLSYVGGFVGALIGTIPWVLMYVYGNYIVSLLAFVIAFCSFKGYTLLCGKKQKNTWLVISAFSIIAVTISTFVTIPILLNFDNGLGLSFEAFLDLYESEEFVRALLGDYVVSLIFAILGISIIIPKIKNDLDQETESKKYSEEDIKKVMDIFKNHQALNKQSAISKSELAKEIDIVANKELLANLKRRRIIIGNQKMYLDEKAYNDIEYSNKVIKKHTIKVVILSILIALLLLFVLILAIPEEYLESDNNSNNNNNNSSENNQTNNGYTEYEILNYATYQLPEYLVVYEDNTDDSYYEENAFYSITYTPLKTYRDDPVFDTVFVDYIPDYYYDDFAEYREYIFESSDDEYQVLEVNLLEDLYDYEVIEIKAESSSGRLYYDYYLYYNNDSLFFEFISGIDYDIDKFQEEIANTLKSAEFLDNLNLQQS